MKTIDSNNYNRKNLFLSYLKYSILIIAMLSSLYLIINDFRNIIDKNNYLLSTEKNTLQQKELALYATKVSREAFSLAMRAVLSDLPEIIFNELSKLSSHPKTP